MKYETIDRQQIVDIMEGREPGPPEGWEDKNKSGMRKKSIKKESNPPVIGGPASEH